MAEELIGTDLRDLPLEDAQRYIRGAVWNHLNLHDYEHLVGSATKLFWLSAHLCAKVFATMFYIDDELLNKPAKVVVRDDRDWAAEIGYSIPPVGREMRRLVCSGFLEEQLQSDGRKHKPQHLRLGPNFPTKVEDEALFRQGDCALEAINKKLKRKLARKRRKKITPRFESRPARIARQFTDEAAEIIKKVGFGNMELYRHLGDWSKVIRPLKQLKLDNCSESLSALDEIIVIAETNLLETMQISVDSALFSSIHKLLADIYALHSALQNKQQTKQQMKQIINEYKDEVCPQ